MRKYIWAPLTRRTIKSIVDGAYLVDMSLSSVGNVLHSNLIGRRVILTDGEETVDAIYEWGDKLAYGDVVGARILGPSSTVSRLAFQLELPNKTFYGDVDSGEKPTPFMTRYYLTGEPYKGQTERPNYGLFLHHIMQSDPDRGHHDHPWPIAASLILKGGYTESRLDWLLKGRDRLRGFKPGMVNIIQGNDFHRLLLNGTGDGTWTLFFHTPRTKGWGFRDSAGNYKIRDEY